MNFFEFKTHEAAITALTGTNKPLTDYINMLYIKYIVDPFTPKSGWYSTLGPVLKGSKNCEESSKIGVLYSYRLITYAMNIRRSKIEIKREIRNSLYEIYSNLLNICHKTIPIDFLIEYNPDPHPLRITTIQTLHRAQEHLVATNPNFKPSLTVSADILDIDYRLPDAHRILSILLDKTYKTPNLYLQKILIKSPNKPVNITELEEHIAGKQLTLDVVTEYIKELK